MLVLSWAELRDPRALFCLTSVCARACRIALFWIPRTLQRRTHVCSWVFPRLPCRDMCYNVLQQERRCCAARLLLCGADLLAALLWLLPDPQASGHGGGGDALDGNKAGSFAAW